MKKAMLLLVTLGLSLFLTLTANATVLTFDELTGQGILPADYAGLVWGSGWEYYDWDQTPYTPYSPPVRVYNNGTPSISFTAPVVFNGAYFAGQPYNSISVDMYLNSVLVASSGQITLSDIPTWLPSGYGQVVDSVFVNSVLAGYFIMDNFTYSGRGVDTPEPSTFLLLGAGIGGLALIRRKARQ